MGRLTLRVPRWLTGRGGPWEGGKTVLKLGQRWKHRKAEAPRGSAPAPGMTPRLMSACPALQRPEPQEPGLGVWLSLTEASG